LLVVTFTRNAITGLILYDIKNKTATELPTGLVKIQNNAVRRVSDTQFVVNSGTTNAPIGIYLIDITKPSEKKLLKSSSSVDLPTSIYSTGRAISFPRKYGDAIGTFSHAIFIPPHNPSFAAPENSKPPPLIVWEHGGPTGHESPSLSLKAQYFTSRGYAYCLVNYAGSTGYGRKYREQLDYNWGLKDCEDTVSCIEYLASQGLVDENKVGITGGSAGGYTVLQGMCSFPTSFSAGCSLYGIGNLKSLAADTHKFESHYLFKLLFPSDTSEDEKEKIYYERSPCFHAQKIERPLVLLQGDIDRVVPMEQAKEMEAILKGQGKDVQLVVFEGEGHGFVRQENIMRALEEEEKLWSRTLL
jgi:dipeptidyl aminopeptidase/acylaminoacyl peptidase